MSGTMEHYPVLPTEATHVVSVNSRLALRDAPAYLASSNQASEDNHIKGEIIDMMPNGTRLIVLDEGVGYECEWVQVLVEGATYPQGSKMWTSSKYVNKLSGIPHSAPMECSEKAWGNPRAFPLLEWTSKASGEVIFDEYDARYKVCIEMSEEEYTSTGGAEIMDRLREAAVHGLKYILRHNGKNSEDDYVTELMTGTDETWFQFVRATEYHVDTKPNSYLKVLVELPHRYVPPLEDAKGVVVTSSGARSLVAWDATERVRIRSTYDTIEFKACCEKLALLLEEYAIDIDAYEGTVNDFDPRAEAERIRQVAGAIDILLRANDITHDTWAVSEILEIGWDVTLTPVFLALTLKDGRVIAMSSGIEEFADTPPIDSQRTQGYIWQLNLLCKAKYSDRPWVEFVQAFTLPDAPTIIPGASGEDSPADISGTEDPAAAEAKKTDGLPVKTYAEKLKEDRQLGDPDFKSKLYEARKDAFEFVGSPIASCEGLQKTLDKINTIDDAFSEVLDKISIADLIKQCMEAISPELSSLSDVSASLGDMPEIGGFGGADFTSPDLGSGIGLGDIPDVGIDYDWSSPSLPGVDTNVHLASLGAMSVDSLGLGSVSFGDLGLGSMSVADLNVGSFTIGSLGIGDLDVSTLGLGSFSLGELGVNLDTLGISDFSFADVDLGTFTAGDLDLDLSPLSFSQAGICDYRLSFLDTNISDLNLTEAEVEAMGHDLDAIDTDSLTFSECEVCDSTIGDFDLDFSRVSMSVFNLSSFNIGDIDINLDSLPLSALGGVSVGALGLDDFSLSELGLDSLSIGSLGISDISMADLNLSNLDMDALGLSGADLAGLSSKFEELGLDGVVSSLEGMGLDSLGVDLSGGIEGLSTELTGELDAARAKLDGMVGKLSTGESPFEQGAPKLIVDLAITLADNLPTEDIMGSMAEAIEDALTMFLQELFVAMTKAVLEQMLENCGENPTQAGKENLNDMLGGSPNRSKQEDPLAGLMAALGTGLAGAGAAAARRNPTSEAARAAVTPELRREMSDMLDDVSLMFTPQELCYLINGKASSKVVLLARNFIAKKYPDMGLKSRTKVSDFFKAFGGLIDPSICRIIEAPIMAAQGPILGDILCSSGDMRDLRKEMLRNKGDDITEEQMDAILDKLKQRKVNAAKILADIVNNGPLSDDYEPPPVTCQKNAQPANAASPNNASANNVPGMDKEGGLVDLTHESIDFAVDIAVDNLFVPVEIAYSNEMRAYPRAYTGDTDKEDTEPIEVWMDKEASMLNPTLMAKFGSKEAYKNWASVNEISGDTIDHKVKIRKAMPPLYNALLNMETNAKLEFGEWDSDSVLFQPAYTDGIDDDWGFTFANGGWGVELILPKIGENDIGAISDVLNSDAADEMDGTMKTAMQSLLSELSANEPKWKIYYVLPKLPSIQVANHTGSNTFLLIATQTFGGTDMTETVVYRTVSTTSLDDGVLATLDDDEIYDLHTVAVSDTKRAAPQHRFASLVYNRWKDTGTNNSLAHDTFVAAADEYFNEITRDVFSYLSQRIANGAYFQNVSSTAISGGDTNQQTSTPVVELLELDPEPTAQQKVDGVSPHPLGLQQKKACAKDNIKNNQCVDFSRPTDGSPADELSDTEQVLMTLCVETIVQTYMTDHYLRGLFANSVFKMPDEPDEAYLSHVASFILADMAAYDMPHYVTIDGDKTAVRPHGTYQDDFIAECIQLYELPSDVDTTTDEPGGEVSPRMAIVQQIEKAYSTVMTQMQTLTTTNNRDDLEEMFLNSYLPTVSISDYGKLESKFFSTNVNWALAFGAALADEPDDAFENAGNIEQVASNISEREQYTVDTDGEVTSSGGDWAAFSSDITSYGDTGSIDFSNGNLYLEHYYLIEDHDEDPGMSEFVSDSTNIWATRGWRYTEEADTATGEAPTDPANYRYFGVVSTDDYAAMVADLPSGFTMHTPVVDVGSGTYSMSAVKSVKRGMRIMYLPPTDPGDVFSTAVTKSDEDEGALDGVFAYTTPSDAELFEASWASSRSNKRTGDAFNQAANGVAATGISKETAVLSKAYKIIEKISSKEVRYGEMIGSGESAVWSGTGSGTAYLFMETNPIPIFDYNYKLGPLGAIADAAQFALGSSTVADADIQTQVLNSDEFKTIIKFLFPVSRMQSILSLYCFHATSSKQEVSSAMAETKDKLRTVFFAINSKGDYKQKDPNLEEVGGLQGLDKMMANEFGLRDMPSGENSWNYNMPVGWGKSVKGLGFEMLAKATAEALQKMFKKWAEKHDPNISLAHKLALVSKMGGVDINTLAWSFMIMPMNVFPFAPIGPPLGPVAIIYHALGLGLWKRVKDGDDASSKEVNSQLRDLGLNDTGSLSPPTTCPDDGEIAWSGTAGTISTISKSSELASESIADGIREPINYFDD